MSLQGKFLSWRTQRRAMIVKARDGFQKRKTLLSQVHSVTLLMEKQPQELFRHNFVPIARKTTAHFSRTNAQRSSSSNAAFVRPLSSPAVVFAFLARSAATIFQNSTTSSQIQEMNLNN